MVICKKKSLSINDGCHGYHMTSLLSVKIVKIPSYFDELYVRNDSDLIL